MSTSGFAISSIAPYLALDVLLVIPGSRRLHSRLCGPRLDEEINR